MACSIAQPVNRCWCCSWFRCCAATAAPADPIEARRLRRHATIRAVAAGGLLLLRVCAGILLVLMHHTGGAVLDARRQHALLLVCDLCAQHTRLLARIHPVRQRCVRCVHVLVMLMLVVVVVRPVQVHAAPTVLRVVVPAAAAATIAATAAVRRRAWPAVGCVTAGCVCCCCCASGGQRALLHELCCCLPDLIQRLCVAGPEAVDHPDVNRMVVNLQHHNDKQQQTHNAHAVSIRLVRGWQMHSSGEQMLAAVQNTHAFPVCCCW